MNRSKAGGGVGDKSGQVGPETLKGIYKNKQFMKQLTTLIGCNMRVSWHGINQLLPDFHYVFTLVSS